MRTRIDGDWGAVRRGLNFIYFGAIILVLGTPIGGPLAGVVLVFFGYIHFLFSPTSALKLLGCGVLISWIVGVIAGLAKAPLVALVAAVVGLSASSLINARIGFVFRNRGLYDLATVYTRILIAGTAVVSLLYLLLEGKQFPTSFAICGIVLAFIAQFIMLKQAKDSIHLEGDT